MEKAGLKKRKILIATGSRAEYGLLYCLMKQIEKDAGLELQMAVTGSHLLPEFGLTVKEIQKDGFSIRKKIPMLEQADHPEAISKSIASGINGFARAYAELKPDIVVVCGDRFELFSICIPALMSKIPVAHIHGGEKTEGSMDDSIRHAITKLSHLHFTATEDYRRRVIQMGEDPERVFNVGAPGLDYLKEVTLLSRRELEKSLGWNFGSRNFLVTYHPPSYGEAPVKQQTENLLRALDAFPEARVIFTKSNADTNGAQVNQMLERYVAGHKTRAVLFASLGRQRYLSALQCVDAVIGNSSSGIHEVPSFKKPTVNIGDRQEGRLKAPSVIDCKPEKRDIVKAVEKALSPEFLEKVRRAKNPYGEGSASVKIKDILKKLRLDESLLKKKFNDLKFTI